MPMFLQLFGIGQLSIEGICVLNTSSSGNY